MHLFHFHLRKFRLASIERLSFCLFLFRQYRECLSCQAHLYLASSSSQRDLKRGSGYDVRFCFFFFAHSFKTKQKFLQLDKGLATYILEAKENCCGVAIFGESQIFGQIFLPNHFLSPHHSQSVSIYLELAKFLATYWPPSSWHIAIVPTKISRNL